jgi:hypothetical protein
MVPAFLILQSRLRFDCFQSLLTFLIHDVFFLHFFQISDQLKSRFGSGLSLPQICENIEKAAYDPRISGIYLHIEPLSCGWGKVDEIRRHIVEFKKSGIHSPC